MSGKEFHGRLHELCEEWRPGVPLRDIVVALEFEKFFWMQHSYEIANAAADEISHEPTN
jgi:hypothetical protein